MGRTKKVHHLEPLKRMNYPAAFVFLDTESRVAKPPAKEVFDVTDHKLRRAHKLRMAVGERWEWNEAQHEYVDQGHGEFLESEYPQPRRLAEAFWKWVEDFATVDRPHVYVMAHNIGYDLLASAAYPVFAARGWKSEAVYHKGPVFIQRLEKNHRRITFLSSSNYYAISLAKLAKGFGMEKGDGDWNGPEEPLLVYCRQDVAILRVAMLWLVGQLRELQTPFADTISSVAFKAFRTRFQTHDIEIHTDPRATLLERRSYCGGRAEPFFIGTLPALGEGEVRSKWDFSCLVDDTRLSDGRRIGDIQVGDVVDGQRVTAVRKTPDAPVVELRLASGHSLRCTPTHRFPFAGYKRGHAVLPASSLHVGRSHLWVDDWEPLHHPENAVMAGIIFAEGPKMYIGRPVQFYDRQRHRLHRTRNYRVDITIDERETELAEFIRSYLRRNVSFFYEKLRWSGRQKHGVSFIVSRKADVLKLAAMVERVKNSSNVEDLRGWLCGFAEGDGSVNAKRHQVVLTQNDDAARQRVREACERLGFHVSEHVGYYNHRMPQGTTAVSKMATLFVRPSDSTRWMEEVSFLSRRKRSRMPARLLARTPVGTTSVTDLSLDGDHLFWANGVKTHNSLYPSVMVDNDVPTRLKSVETDWSVDRLNRALDEGEAVIADVTVDVPMPCVPLKWSRLVFPVGKFPTVLTTPELQAVREEGGHILEVRDVARYDKARIFKGFIDHFWSMRAKAIAEGNDAVKQLAKNIMNNCLDEKTVLVDGRRIGDLRVGDWLEGQRVVRVERTRQPAYRLRFESGHEVIATADHKFPTYNAQNTRMKLRPVIGTRLHPGFKTGRHATAFRVNDWPVPSLPEEAVMAGILWAEGPTFQEGTLSRNSRRKYPRWRINISTNQNEHELNDFVRDFLTRRGVNFHERTRPFIATKVVTISNRRDVQRLAQMYRRVLKFRRRADAAGFLRGAFEGDGSAHGRCVRLTQNSRSQRAIAKRALTKLGLRFREVHRVRHNILFQTNGYFYPRTDEWVLQVDSDVTRFMREISFLSSTKRQRVLARLVARTCVGRRSVVDISLMGGDHLFWAGGVRSSNCYG